jgi:osmotically-inducible protein OsmY
VPPSDASSLDDLAGQVLLALDGLPIRGLEVSATAGGIVNLDGTARSAADRAEAGRLAGAVPGVTHVANALLVDPLVDSLLDADLASPTDLATGIEPAGPADGTEIDFNAELGTTDATEATDEAIPYFPPTDPPVRPAPRGAGGIEIVDGFAGTALDAPIEAEQPPDAVLAGDDEIAREVRLALKEDAATADLAIRVAVRDGVVRLRGVVPTLSDAELAEEVAWRVPGVVAVEEELDVAST